MLTLITKTQGKEMLKLIKTIAAVGALALMTACGGGGGGGGDGLGSRSYGGESITYIVSGGLRWSSPSATTYIYSSGFNSIELDANGYCSRSTSTNGGPAVPSNFNNEAGWRIPTEAQILAFRTANPNATGWDSYSVWFEPNPTYTGSLNTNLNYGTGVVTYANVAAKAHVVCVKPV